MTTKTNITTMLCVMAALIFGCNRQRIDPVVLKSDQVSNDFVLTAYVKESNTVYGYPSRESTDMSFSGRVEVRSPDGVKIAEGLVLEGLLSGPFATWHRNGRINSLEYYDAGEIDGVGVHWDEDTHLSRSTAYRKGTKDGAETYWGADGISKTHITWKAGQPVLIRLYDKGNVVTNLTGQDADDYMLERLGRRARPRH